MILAQIRTVIAALRAVYADSGFAMAGAVAYAFVLSLFPFCIFLGALAGVFGGEERAREGIQQLFQIVPKPVAEALAPEVMAVMGSSRYDLLTFGAFIALFFATSAIESLRAALNVAYRDFRYVVPFLVQLWMFATPSIYMNASANGRGQLDWVLIANPLSPLIQSFRAAVLGGPIPWNSLALAAAISVAMFLAGCLYFRRVEDSFSDII